jgi:hypothetical protein
MKQNRVSILQMVGGAIQERVDYEVSRVVDNILDMNTEPDAKRKITLTIELQPDENRQTIKLKATAKSTLAPTTAINNTLAITADGNGEMVIAEITPQVPGQISLEGKEQAAPKLLKMAAHS